MAVMDKIYEHVQAVDTYCKSIGAVRILTALYGSQNYNLHTPTSDVDTKSIIIPNLQDWLWGEDQQTNKVLTLADGSHAECKPVVDMFKQYLKGNINFLETLITPPPDDQ